MSIPPEQLAAMRQTIQQSTSPFGDPSPVDEIAHRLLLEVERLQAEDRDVRRVVGQQIAALEKRLADLVVWRGECQSCRNAEAHAFLVQLRKAMNG